MNIITLDFETFYSADYTLSSMTTEEYVRDPRFEVHGASIKWVDSADNGSAASEAYWYRGEELRDTLRHHDWTQWAVLCHHTHFDGLILSHHYGIKPAYYLDTLSMARLLFGNHIRKGLGDLAELLGLGHKTIDYGSFKGKHWHELTAQEQQNLAQGCCDDVDLTWRLFEQLAKSFPAREYAFVDATVRMFTQPMLVGDTPLLGEIWQQEADTKRALLEKLGVTASDLRKQHLFAKLLRAEGIEPEQKLGEPAKCKKCDGTGHNFDSIPIRDEYDSCTDCDGKGTIARYNYSFAKTDDFMRNLLEDETPLATMPEATVSMLAQAKLDAHSTGTQTRVERMGHMSTRGALCVYLNYAGTHLAGWSGGDKCLTADTQVLVVDISGVPSYKNIVDVQLSDLVWDGEEFVPHDGVVFQGFKEVVSWDGINGTPEHKVCCGEAWKELGQALRDQTPIVDCREPTLWEVEAARRLQRDGDEG
jgi:hypothetical protein